MQFGPGNTSATTTASQSGDSWAAAETLANGLTFPGADSSGTVNFSGSAVINALRTAGTSPPDVMSGLAAMSAYMQSHPGNTIDEAAASTGLITPNQANKLAITAQKQDAAASSGGNVGLISDIMGDVVEVLYPFIMWGVAGVAALGATLVLVVAVIKSPVGKTVLDLGAKAALAGLL